MKFAFSIFPELKTDRLVLRKTTFEDAQAVFYIRSNREVNQYIQRENPKSINDAKNFISKVNDGFVQGETLYWAICLKADLKMIGSICLWHFNFNRKRAELGYDLFPAFQHQGIMTEALHQVLSFGYQQLHLLEMEAFTHFQNKHSIKLLIKNEFYLVEGESDQDNINNVIYRIKKEV